MTENNQNVLVFPRKLFQDYDRFVSWSTASSVVRHADDHVVWLPRGKAERSKHWVQPIPCALIRTHSQKYCVLRRVRETRPDLRARISLIVGGHVDRPSNLEKVLHLFLKTLRQELGEEVGVRGVRKITPVGLVIDSSSRVTSRHIAFVYETVVDRRLTVQAPEEFSSRSKFTGSFFAPAELSRFRTSFDPWSRVLFEDYIAPSRSLKTAR